MIINLYIQMLFSFVATVSFAIITNIPKRFLFPCGVTGMIGWLIFWVSIQVNHHIGISNFLAAFFIGILSILFSRMLKTPMIIFNIPSLVPLVPGGAIYQAMRYFISENYTLFAQNLVVVLITAASIAIAFFVINFVEKVIQVIQRRKY